MKKRSSNVLSGCDSGRRRSAFSQIGTKWLHFGLFLFLTGNVHGDFVAPYALTPPDPGSYQLAAVQTAMSFGNWNGKAGAAGIGVDTTSAPTNLLLSVDRTRSAGGWFWARAAAAGTVTFEYTVAGQDVGAFSWYNNGPDDPYASAFLMRITNLVTEPTTASFHVEAGDLFGFHVSVSPPFGQFVPAQRFVTIRNFSAPEAVVGLPTLSIYDLVIPEPTNGTANAVFPVRLSAAHTQAVTVAYSTMNATATAGSDYEATSGTITFDPGETNKTITVTVLADAINEGTETFLTVLSDPTNATLARSQGTCTINELRITALTFDVNVSFNSVNQARYRVESTDDGTNWSAVPGSENVLGTGNMVTVTHTNAACNPGRIYRVLLLE